MAPRGFSIIVPAHDAEATLADALESLRTQTYETWNAVVVDDGSTDGTLEIAERFATTDARVTVRRQANAGESAARNTGLVGAAYDWLVFLDADDWLHSHHLARMAAAISSHREADVVHGGWVLVSHDGRQSSHLFAPDTHGLFPELARRNCFAIHACAVRRSVVESVGAFDVTLRTCPDWDLWQRIARAGRRFVPVSDVVAFYRLRPGSAGTNPVQLLTDGLRVIARGHGADPRVSTSAPGYAHGMPDGEEAARLAFASWAAGLAIGRDERCEPMLDLVPGVRAAVAPEEVAENLFAAVPRARGDLIDAWPTLWRSTEPAIDAFLFALQDRVEAPDFADRCKSLLMEKILRWGIGVSPSHQQDADVQRLVASQGQRIEELRGWIAELDAAKTWHDQQRLIWYQRAMAAERGGAGVPPEHISGSPFAAVRMSEPVSREWGFDRGLPVDRYYIEQFLARHSSDVRGRVLEVGSNAYTRRFGMDRVTQSDVLHVTPDNPDATFVGDLTQAHHIPDDAFDCIVLTQTLQLVYDLPAALKTLHRILKPGGVLLATFPGLTRTSHVEWPGSWFWRLTPASARRLFEDQFAAEQLELSSFGNVLAACAFLYGVATEELTASELDRDDSDYDVVVAVRARKASTAVQDGQRRSTPQRPAPTGNVRALVLLYHRIDESPSDPWELSVSPERFDAQMRVLERTASVVRVEQLAEMVASGKADRPIVAVTFDDGYADNRHQALPILERYRVPATMFICTDPVAQGAEFWWDALERLLLSPGTLPSSLVLRIQEVPFTWELGSSAVCSDSQLAAHRHWRAWEPGPTERHALYSALWERLQPLAARDRAEVLAQLVMWAASEPQRPRFRALTVSELQIVANSELVEIGAHTMHHPALSRLSLPEQQAEIRGSKAWLEGVLGRPVTSFSYPFGRVVDYSPDTVTLVRRAGFTAACANVHGIVHAGADPFQLPRVQVKNWDGGTFERQIQQWLPM